MRFFSPSTAEGPDAGAGWIVRAEEFIAPHYLLSFTDDQSSPE